MNTSNCAKADDEIKICCSKRLARWTRRRKAVLATLCSLLLLSIACIGAQAGSVEPSASVDPFIGTGWGGPGGAINLFPGATMPFGMVQLSPDTESKGYGYHYAQPAIQGFSMTHMSGPGCANEGDVFFTATAGPVRTEVSEFESPYSHSAESAAPGYYRVLLSRWGINAELTATDRTGLARFTFPAGKPANILVPISHTLNRTVRAEVHVAGDREITGYVENYAFCGTPQTYKVYFAMTFSRPFSSFGTWQGTLPEKASRHPAPGSQAVRGTKTAAVPAPLVIPNGRQAEQSRHGQWIGAYASWPAASQTQTITARIGISYADLAGAENNLKAESAGKSFGEVERAARAAWNKALGVIEVSGGSERDRRVFYTALYHSLLMPSIFSDADGRYIGFDGKIHHVAPGHLIYANFSGWDIYRSEMPLLALIEPRRMEDMCQSIVLMYQQGGWIGRWPQINRYTNVMAGSPLTVVMSMAWLDGLRGFDMKTAWQGMVLDSTQAPPPGKPYTGQDSIDWINKLHYVPNDKGKYGSVSQLQEDSIAYASLYRLARALGKADDAKMFYDRALYYRNLFDPADGFFRPRNSDGQWVPDFDPASENPGQNVFHRLSGQLRQMKHMERRKMVETLHRMLGMSATERQQFLKSSEVQRSFSPQDQNILKSASRLMAPTGFIEGSGWHYQWLEPADLAWVIRAVGKDRFNQRLLDFFNYPKPGWFGQYYNPYNETDLEAPFEFNFSGLPWETQRVVRRVLRENYTTSPDGVPGNDDCGEMSSWAVLSMMGIYTVDPASLAYELVSPVFSKVVVHLQPPYSGKDFTVEAGPGPESNPYIQQVKLNGKRYKRNWIPFGAISSGGTLQFTLGPEPHKSWGASPKDAPPSLSKERP